MRNLLLDSLFKGFTLALASSPEPASRGPGVIRREEAEANHMSDAEKDNS